MKTIKIKFCDFWAHWNENDNFIINALRKKYNVEISEQPEYIFFSHFNEKMNHMDYNDCIKIFYTQENIVPDFNYADYGIAYDYMDYGDRYLRYPIFCVPERYAQYWDMMRNKHRLDSIQASELKDREFCSFVVSNPNGFKIREEFFYELSKYKKVNSGGKYLNNIGIEDGVEDKLVFQKKHKFSLCFENTSHPGYTTEKIIEAYAARTVPIYWGDPSITQMFNKDSFINIMDFSNIEDAIEYIKEIDCDDSKYLEMLKAPALNIGYETFYEEKQEELFDFLNHVVDQDVDKALRRNILFAGRYYHQKYYDMRNEYFDKLNIFIRKVRNRIKRMWHK